MPKKIEKKWVLDELSKYMERFLSGIDKTEKDWLLKKFANVEEVSGTSQEVELAKIMLELLVSDFSKAYQRSNSKDLKKFSEKYFSNLLLEREMEELELKIDKLEAGQIKKAKELDEELTKFHKNLEKTNPEFLDRYHLRISEMSGDLMAILTDGRMGSTRKVIKLERKKKK